MLTDNCLISELYSSHKQELSRYIGKQFKLEHTESEDIIHMTFIKLSQLPGVGELENPRAYLFRMVHNQVIDHKRGESRREAIEEQGGEQAHDEASTLADPARISCAQERLDIIQQAMEAMPEQRRRILNMSRHEQLSNMEIARRLGISEAAVRKHITRALVDIKLAIKSASSEG